METQLGDQIILATLEETRLQTNSMAWIGNYILDLASRAVFGYNVDGQPEQVEKFPNMNRSDGYQPSISEVFIVKEALHNKSRLPYELVDLIVDLAEYWPHTTTVTSQPLVITAGRHREEERLVVSLSNFARPIYPKIALTGNS